MSKKILTQATYAVDNVQQLPVQVKNQASLVQQTFDKSSLDQKTYNNSTLLSELQSETANDAGANAIGAEGTFGTNNVGDELKAAKIAIDSKAGSSDVYTKSETYTKTEVNALDVQNVKLTGNQTIAGTKTFSSLPEVPTTPTLGVHPTSKLYVDNSILGIVVGTLPDGSITDDKLSNDPGQAKDNISKNETNIANLQIDVTNTKSRIFMLGGM